MTLLKVSRLTLALAGASFAAGDAPLAGKWQIHINVGGTEREQACSFTQKDKDLSGTCNTDRGDVRITGKVEDKKITWTYKSDYNGSPLTVTFQGAMESPDRITGSVVAEEFGVGGEFTATLSK